MASDRSKRIEANCKNIWGDGDYDIDVETDDWTTYYGYIKRDFGLSYGPLLLMTAGCRSPDHVFAELDRMLDWGLGLTKRTANDNE